jgi:hypothetical protein
MPPKHSKKIQKAGKASKLSPKDRSDSEPLPEPQPQQEAPQAQPQQAAVGKSAIRKKRGKGK